MFKDSTLDLLFIQPCFFTKGFFVCLSPGKHVSLGLFLMISIPELTSLVVARFTIKPKFILVALVFIEGSKGFSFLTSSTGFG